VIPSQASRAQGRFRISSILYSMEDFGDIDA
jgi:hypothetical protein